MPMTHEDKALPGGISSQTSTKLVGTRYLIGAQSSKACPSGSVKYTDLAGIQSCPLSIGKLDDPPSRTPRVRGALPIIHAYGG